jgi:predicted lipase
MITNKTLRRVPYSLLYQLDESYYSHRVVSQGVTLGSVGSILFDDSKMPNVLNSKVTIRPPTRNEIEVDHWSQDYIFC